MPGSLQDRLGVLEGAGGFVDPGGGTAHRSGPLSDDGLQVAPVGDIEACDGPAGLAQRLQRGAVLLEPVDAFGDLGDEVDIQRRQARGEHAGEVGCLELLGELGPAQLDQERQQVVELSHLLEPEQRPVHGPAVPVHRRAVVAVATEHFPVRAQHLVQLSRWLRGRPSTNR